MCRPPGIRAALTCTSAGISGSSKTSGSGSWAVPSPKARNPRSTPPRRRRKTPCPGTPRGGRPAPSVAEQALQAPLGLGERRLQLGQLVAVAEAQVAGEAEMLAGAEQHAVLGADLFDDVHGAHRL